MARDLTETFFHGIHWKTWIERIPKRENFVLSVDIGTSALKWALMKETKEGPLFLEGGIDPPSRFRELLEKKAFPRRCKIRVAISGPKVLLKRALLPKMPLKEAATALRWQLKEEIPFPIQEAYLDFQQLRAFEKEGKPLLDLLVGIAHRDLVDYLISASSGTPSFEIASIEPGVHTVSELLPQDKKGDVALVDLGASSTYVGILHDGLLEVGREIPIGGEDLTRAIACEIIVGEKKISLEKEEAERAKIAYGISQKGLASIGDSEIPSEKLWILMRPILERLVGDMKRFFQFYEKGTPPREIQEIWLTGGTSGLQGLSELLERQLGLSPRLVSFIGHYRFAETFLKDQDRNEMERRLGIAVATALPRKKIFNFLPPEIVAKKAYRLRKKVTKGIAIFFVLFVLGFHTLFTVQGLVLRKKLQEEKRDWENLVSQREEYILWKDKKKQAERIGQLFSTFAKNRPPWEGVLKELSWVVPKEISLKTVSVKGEGRPEEKEAYVIRLEGETRTSKEPGEEVLTHFLEDFEASPFFRETKLVSTEGMASREGVVPFEITGHLELE